MSESGIGSPFHQRHRRKVGLEQVGFISLHFAMLNWLVIELKKELPLIR